MSKAYAQREAVQSDAVAFSICGSTQPQPFCLVLEKLISTNDGLIDRFVQLSAAAIVSRTPSAMTQAVSTIDREWPTKLLTFIYDKHQTTPATTYRLSDESAAELQIFRNAENERTEMVVNDAVEALSGDAEDNNVDISFDFGNSKDIDNGLRLSVLLHILKHGFLHVLSNNDDHEIPYRIPRDCFILAFELLSIMKTQMKTYKHMLFEDIDKGTKRNLIGSANRVTNSKEANICRLLLKFPGPIVTSTMIIRKARVDGATCVSGSLYDFFRMFLNNLKLTHEKL